MRMKKNQCAIKWNRHLVHLRDGGCISLDWAIENKNLKEEIIEEEDEGIVDYQPILALIPGITGENMDKYLEDTIIEANQYGFKCVVVNHRGMSSTTLTVCIDTYYIYIYIYRLKNYITQRAQRTHMLDLFTSRINIQHPQYMLQAIH